MLSSFSSGEDPTRYFTVFYGIILVLFLTSVMYFARSMQHRGANAHTVGIFAIGAFFSFAGAMFIFVSFMPDRQSQMPEAEASFVEAGIELEGFDWEGLNALREGEVLVLEDHLILNEDGQYKIYGR